MKKYLSIICALLTLTAFTSCGDSSSISETPEVSESIVLDSVFENDYLKISVNANWEQDVETFNNKNYIDWKWEDENSLIHYISLDITEDYSGKMSLEDFKSTYYVKGLNHFNDWRDNLIDSFEENNQAYVVTENTTKHCISFKTNKISGEFTYSNNDEEIVMDMIKSMEFDTMKKEIEQETTIKKEAYDLDSEIGTAKPTKEITTEKSTKRITEKATEPPEPANVGDNEAIESAKDYIELSGFSYEGLISQLEYEGFSHDKAVYGADNCGADWQAEALESAKDYINISGFSYNGLVKQLEYEKFTHEQAVYGADNCGADWNQQAANAARSYLDIMSMSREELLSQLLYEGFTQEQAEYGVQSVGY